MTSSSAGLRLLSRICLLLVACRGTPAPNAPSAGVIDSHVHLDYEPVADQLAAAGIVAVVDLGGPIEMLARHYPITVIGSGPMITSPGGYPTDAWAPPSY